MKKRDKNGDNFVDALAKEHRYAVLSKPGRVQILLQPTAKQLRKRGKRGWHLNGTVGGGDGDGRMLMTTIRGAIRELEDTGEPAVNGKGRPSRPRKAKPTKKT